MSVPRNAASGSSSWPTARAQDSYERSNRKTVLRAAAGEVQMTLTRRVRIWPTPNATDGSKAPDTFGRGNPSLPKAAKTWKTPRAIYGDHPGMDDADHLTGQARSLWMTPQSRDWKDSGPDADVPENRFLGRQAPLTVRDGLGSSPPGRTLPPLWRSPHASKDIGMRPEDLDGELGSRMYRRDGTNQTVDAQIQARILMGNSRLRLNPRFVEVLMGLPVGYSEPCPTDPTDSGPSGTRSYLSRQRSLYESCCRDLGISP